MSLEDLPQNEEKEVIDQENELEFLVYTYNGPHFHDNKVFPCTGTCEQAILAKEILRLRNCMVNTS